MIKSFKYRICPNVRQEKVLLGQLENLRILRNWALQEKKNYYKKYGKSLRKFDQYKELQEVRILCPEYQEIFVQSLRDPLLQLDLAFKSFSRRLKNGEKGGFPRFKKRGQFSSICFPQILDNLNKSNGIKRLPNGKLQIFGIPGQIKVKWSRSFEGTIKQARIKVEKDGKWYLILICDQTPLKILPKTGKQIGIDLGLNKFISTSEGREIHYPKFGKTSKDKLAERQRQLSRKQKHSKNARKAKSHVARLHQKIKSQREDFQWKVAKQLVQDNDLIVIEDLDIQGMISRKNKKASKSKIRKSFALPFNVSDASWHAFSQKLLFKAESAGKEVIKVDPRGTSQTCSECDHVNDKKLELFERTFVCEVCNFACDRDLNASKNILKRGLSSRKKGLGQSLGEISKEISVGETFLKPPIAVTEDGREGSHEPSACFLATEING